MDQNDIQQNLLQMVFEEKNTQRYQIEGFRNTLLNAHILIQAVKDQIQRFFWYNIFDKGYREQKLRQVSFLQANADNEEEELNRQNAICIDDEEFVSKVNSYIED